MVRNLIQYFVIALAMAIVISGCSKEQKSAEQQEFIQKFRTLKNEYDNISSKEFIGKLNIGQKLPPKDLEQQAEKKYKEFREFIDKTQPTAELWDGTIGAMKREKDHILISANYDGHFYYLRIFDPKGMETVEQFKQGDKIKFSGNLGRETSKTLYGALHTPEFEFYPTYVQHRNGEINQPIERINELVEIERRALQAKQEKKRQSAIDSQIQDRIQEVCREVLVRNLKYPESAEFPWFKKKFVKEASNKWIYYDVVKAKNEFGGEIPRRFKCSAVLSKDEIHAEVYLTDGMD